MTPIDAFVVTFVTALLSLALVAGKSVARRLDAQRDLYRRHSKRFFIKTEKLIANPEFPVEGSFLLRALSYGLGMSHLPWLLAFSPVRRAVLCGAPQLVNSALDRIEVSIQAAPDEVRRQFCDTRDEALLALSYRSLLVGHRLRKSMQNRPNHNSREQGDKVIVRAVGSDRLRPPRFETSAGKLAVA